MGEAIRLKRVAKPLSALETKALEFKEREFSSLSQEEKDKLLELVAAKMGLIKG